MLSAAEGEAYTPRSPEERKKEYANVLKKLSAMSADSIDEEVDIVEVPARAAKPAAGRQQKTKKRRKRENAPPLKASTAAAHKYKMQPSRGISARAGARNEKPHHRPPTVWRASTEKSWSDASMQDLFR